MMNQDYWEKRQTRMVWGARMPIGGKPKGRTGIELSRECLDRIRKKLSNHYEDNSVDNPISDNIGYDSFYLIDGCIIVVHEPHEMLGSRESDYNGGENYCSKSALTILSETQRGLERIVKTLCLKE